LTSDVSEQSNHTLPLAQYWNRANSPPRLSLPQTAAVDRDCVKMDLAVLGFTGIVPEATGRPSYHPATLLKIYLYGYLN
jgi:hypothetical protein